MRASALVSLRSRDNTLALVVIRARMHPLPYLGDFDRSPDTCIGSKVN